MLGMLALGLQLAMPVALAQKHAAHVDLEGGDHALSSEMASGHDHCSSATEPVAGSGDDAGGFCAHCGNGACCMAACVPVIVDPARFLSLYAAEVYPQRAFAPHLSSSAESLYRPPIRP